MLAGPVLPALLAFAARILPLPLTLAPIHAVAAGHAILQAGGAVSARRRKVLNPVSTPQTRSTAQTRSAPEARQCGWAIPRSYAGADPRALAGPDAGPDSVGESRPRSRPSSQSR
jgi:hypothetical protein